MQGYLAALQTRAEDLPRYVLTGAGVISGGYFGFSVLPPSYFHTYAMFSALGGLCGFLAYRGATILFPATFERWFPSGRLASQVEKERAERIVPLTSEERLSGGGPSKAPQSRGKVLAAAAALITGAAALLIGVWMHVPARIGTLEDMPAGLDTTEEREALDAFVLGVPTETSAERTQQTYAGLSEVLRDGYSRDSHIFRAESYGALALAVESGKVDAAFLPGASTYALLKRTKLGVDVLAQAQFHGETTYSGVLVAREGLKQRPLPSKRGGAPGGIVEAGALTEVESNTEAERLFGTRIAFVQMDSLSGYLAPVSWLGQHGVRMTDLGEVVFAQTHTRALSLLRSGRVDIAATFDRVLLEAQKEDPTFKPEILARFDGLPNALLVTRPGLPEERREKLLQVLTSVFKDDTQTKHALEDGAAMDGLVPASVDAVREVGKWLE